MKKGTTILVVLLIAAPVMAAVTVSVTDNKDLTATISYTDDGDPNYVLAFALDITVDNDANITGVTTATSGDCNSTEQDYDIFLVSFREIDAGGVTVEIVSLYEDANSPPLSAPLCTVTVDKACNMTVSVNEDCGGVVMEDANSITPDLAAATGVPTTSGECRTCKGDLDDNCWVMISDYGALINLLGAVGPPYMIPKDHPLYNPCADMDDNDWIMTSDLGLLINKLGAMWPYPYVCPDPCPKW